MNSLAPLVRSMSAAGLEVCEQAESFLQSALWGRFKERFGWESRAFIVDWDGFGERPLLTLSRRLAPGIAMTYVPWGPELPEAVPTDSGNRSAALASLARALRPRLPHSAAFIRFDPPWYSEGSSPPPAIEQPFRRAAAGVQPPDTVLVDLLPGEAAILAAMKPKWRYNIGLAKKHGVTVTQSGEAALDTFYQLLTQTAARDGIAVHSAEYYKALFELCRGGGSGGEELALYTASHSGDTLAAIVVLRRGKTATYLYGASANLKRNLMAPYALQWQAMQDAKAAGCAVYDLFGIPPNDDPAHPMAGLYRFKTGFGGSIIHRSGSWDYITRPLPHALFSAAEKLRKTLRDRKKR